MIQELKIPLSNGYNLVAMTGMRGGELREIYVGTTDSDDTWNQDIVRIYIGDGDEKFKVQVFQNIESDDATDEFEIGLYRDPVIEDSDSDPESGVETEEEQESIFDSNDIPDDDSLTTTLKPGDRGEPVKGVQRRLKDLGYFDGSIGGNYLTKTTAAVQAFQKAAGLNVDGVCNVETMTALFSDDAPKNEKQADDISSPAIPAKGKAVPMDWWKSDIQKIFSKGTVATITDVETGLAWRERRRGGTNHADCEPLTAADTAALKKTYGGTWSWNRRAVFVTINGVNYAASMNGMPHGNGSIKDNAFDGHHCFHFLRSKTHCSGKVCSKHQAAIRKALAATL